MPSDLSWWSLPCRCLGRNVLWPCLGACCMTAGPCWTSRAPALQPQISFMAAAETGQMRSPGVLPSHHLEAQATSSGSSSVFVCLFLPCLVLVLLSGRLRYPDPSGTLRVKSPTCASRASIARKMPWWLTERARHWSVSRTALASRDGMDSPSICHTHEMCLPVPLFGRTLWPRSSASFLLLNLSDFGWRAHAADN